MKAAALAGGLTTRSGLTLARPGAGQAARRFKPSKRTVRVIAQSAAAPADGTSTSAAASAAAGLPPLLPPSEAAPLLKARGNLADDDCEEAQALLPELKLRGSDCISTVQALLVCRVAIQKIGNLKRFASVKTDTFQFNRFGLKALAEEKEAGEEINLLARGIVEWIDYGVQRQTGRRLLEDDEEGGMRFIAHVASRMGMLGFHQDGYTPQVMMQQWGEEGAKPHLVVCGPDQSEIVHMVLEGRALKGGPGLLCTGSSYGHKGGMRATSDTARSITFRGAVGYASVDVESQVKPADLPLITPDTPFFNTTCGAILANLPPEEATGGLVDKTYYRRAFTAPVALELMGASSLIGKPPSSYTAAEWQQLEEGFTTLRKDRLLMAHVAERMGYPDNHGSALKILCTSVLGTAARACQPSINAAIKATTHLYQPGVSRVFDQPGGLRGADALAAIGATGMEDIESSLVALRKDPPRYKAAVAAILPGIDLAKQSPVRSMIAACGPEYAAVAVEMGQRVNAATPVVLNTGGKFGDEALQAVGAADLDALPAALGKLLDAGDQEVWRVFKEVLPGVVEKHHWLDGHLLRKSCVEALARRCGAADPPVSVNYMKPGELAGADVLWAVGAKSSDLDELRRAFVKLINEGRVASVARKVAPDHKMGERNNTKLLVFLARRCGVSGSAQDGPPWKLAKSAIAQAEDKAAGSAGEAALAAPPADDEMEVDEEDEEET